MGIFLFPCTYLVVKIKFVKKMFFFFVFTTINYESYIVNFIKKRVKHFTYSQLIKIIEESFSLYLKSE